MKNRPHAIKRDAYARAGALADLRAAGEHQAFNVAPNHIRPRRIREDGGERRTMPSADLHIVSLFDIISRRQTLPLTPSPEAVAEARAIVAAFADNPGAGVTSLNGEMLDRPHLERAKRVLSRAPKE